MDKLLALLKKAGIKDDEIEAAKADIEAEREAEVEGLKRKNAELIRKSKEVKSDEGGKVAELEAKIEELTAATEKAQREAEKSVKALTKERDELKTNLDATTTKAREYQTGVTLREALGKIGVGKLNPEDVTDAVGFVKSMLKYNDKGEALVAYKDGTGKDIEQALSEYIEKVYPTTSHAKRFIPASGSGAGGGLNLKKPDGQTKKWGEMDLKERTLLYKENPTLAKQLQEAEPGIVG